MSRYMGSLQIVINMMLPFPPPMSPSLHLMDSTTLSIKPVSSALPTSFQITNSNNSEDQSILSGGINCSSPSFSQTYSKPIMSAIEMASIGKFRYHRFRPETGFDDEERDRVVLRPKKWYRFRRIPIRKKFRLKFPSLRRLWRRKARVVSAVRKSYAKVKKRLKEGQVHFGDLFAGNYLFLQVNPTSLSYLEREMSLSKIA